jgi:type II secretory pathway pseudopilin PulG
MLVTVGVIVILASILITALSQAGRAAQRGKTRFLMTSIKDAITRFEADHGYLPPILGANGTGEGQPGFGRDLLGLPGSTYELQGYYSVTSLPEYLLGYDDRRMDGFGYVATSSALLPPDDSLPGHREHPALGIRSPGPDGVWNATLNPRMGPGGNGLLFLNRNPGNMGNLSFGNNAQMPGKVYGPYLDLKDATVLGEVAGLDFDDSDQNALRQTWDRVILPGDDGFGSGDNPKVFLDYWGSPIRFYRKPPQHLSVPSTLSGASLGDIIALRPTSYEVGVGATSDYADANDDDSTSRALKAANYALFSPGADRKNVESKRFDDANGYNGDNIVEMGQ